MLETEPGAKPRLSEARLETTLRTVADFVDLKSPYTAGHSSGVAELAASAAAGCDLPDPDVTAVRRAVDNGIWDKAGPLT